MKGTDWIQKFLDLINAQAKLVELKKFLHILRDDNLVEIPSYFRFVFSWFLTFYNLLLCEFI